MEFAITVAIPTRDRADKLYYALKSCAAQVSKRIQFLIVDNASDIRTHEIAKEFLYDCRFKYKRYDVSASINEQFLRCARDSDGEWLCIIGDDDCLYPDFADQLSKVVNRIDSSISLISWEQGQYRWPCFGSAERNRLAARGVLRRGEETPYRIGSAGEFMARIETGGVKSLYAAPGIYHRAARRCYIDGLLDRFGSDDLFKHSPDISFQAHAIYSESKYIHLYSPLSLNGYSATSTGSAFAGNDSSKYAKKYISENPGLVHDFFSSFPMFGQHYSPVFSEVLGTYIIMITIAPMHSCQAPSLDNYIRSEIANARKLAPSLRLPMRSQLEFLAKSVNIAYSEKELAVFDSVSPSSSLASQDFCKLLTLQAPGMQTDHELSHFSFCNFSRDMEPLGIQNVCDAATWAYLYLTGHSAP